MLLSIYALITSIPSKCKIYLFFYVRHRSNSTVNECCQCDYLIFNWKNRTVRYWLKLIKIDIIYLHNVYAMVELLWLCASSRSLTQYKNTLNDTLFENQTVNFAFVSPLLNMVNSSHCSIATCVYEIKMIAAAGRNKKWRWKEKEKIHCLEEKKKRRRRKLLSENPFIAQSALTHFTMQSNKKLYGTNLASKP